MMDFGFVASAVTIGFAAGMAPGPTSALVISQTLRFGFWEGFKIALAPLITDVPVLILSVFAIGLWSNPVLIAFISILGGALLLFMSYELALSKFREPSVSPVAPHSFIRGCLTNLCNPGPYLFWGTVGAPMLIGKFQVGTFTGVAYLVLFFAAIVGAKILLAVLAKYSSFVIRGKAYVLTTRLLALVLSFYSVLFFSEGVSYLVTLMRYG